MPDTAEMTVIDPSSLPRRDAYYFMISALIPRPIAFVSTVGKDGVMNCAPFSFFMGVTSDPPTLAVSIGSRKGVPKDSARNILDTGEFAVNIVVDAIAEKMNLASGEYPPDVSEFAVTGLTPVASDLIKAPRIAESPISMECRLVHHVDVGNALNAVVFGEILRYHVRADVLDETGKLVDPMKLHAIGRLGPDMYTRVNNVFVMERPK